MQASKPVLFNGVALVFENEQIKVCIKTDDGKWKEVIVQRPLDLVAGQIIVCGIHNADGPENKMLNERKEWA